MQNQHQRTYNTGPHIELNLGFPGSSLGKEPACNVEDLGLIPGSGRSPVEGNGYPVQYSFLESSMVRGAWRDILYGVTKSRTRLSE